MRDTDDEMVSQTLRALADLVPILGAKTVVGKNRRKVFARGEPGEVSFIIMMTRGNKLIEVLIMTCDKCLK